ncbi:alpha/beta hydrolase [Paraburkholderia bryophila]|uniref:alpha/beta fold hydrolase n=1 Tax=Paraburkholderia bryophila TaxID=420952 RepID=UPI00234983E4|nr:alpha/beta fold hydrolase [Paraburkholderia bryophila]WCM23659.1 alpha/beta hydrolase [Paraburkholderia bryophila]
MSIHAMDEARDLFCDLPTGVRLCYRTYGLESGHPLLLIAGLSLQLTSWPSNLIDDLVQRGFHVIVLDNRDVGRSSRIPQKPPGLLRQFLRLPIPSAYGLEDMAADTVGLLDHLRVARAHVVGMSMGGMIAQIIAGTHPQRTWSLTSIFSSTGSRKVGQPAISSMSMLTKPPARTRDEAVQRYSAIMAHIGTQTYPVNDAGRRAYAADAWDRDQPEKYAEGMARQFGAIIKSGDRTADIRRIRVPTLVVHGDRDLMVAANGGTATAAAIPGAEMVTIRGMGHDISEGVVPLLVDLIDGHARRSTAGSAAEQTSASKHSA